MITINVKSKLTGRDETYISKNTPGLLERDLIKNGLRIFGCHTLDDLDIQYDNGTEVKGIQKGTDNVFTIKVS